MTTGSEQRMNIDPRLFEGNDTDDPRQWFAEKLTVIIDVWVAEYIKDPETADERLRQNGLIKVADRLVELFGAEWWTRLPGAPAS